jgi:neutral ceramidase
LSWSEDEASFGINRRNNTEQAAPALRAGGQLKGPSDPRVPVLAVRAADGGLRALLVSYACHNTTLMLNQWHGDYAGCAQEELERRHPGAAVLFAPGCGADINPNPRRELAHAVEHGRALADAADRALAKPMQAIAGTFGSAFEDITLSFARRPTEAQILEAREKNQPNREMHQAWAEAVSTRLRTLGDDALKYSYPIQTWKLGDLSWIALGGEVVVDYALRLRRELGDRVWVFGYSTDVMAYIPNERVLKEGRYEGETSMIPYGLPGPWVPGLEDKIVDKARELVTKTR